MKEQRSEIIKFRVTKEEKQTIEDRANQSNMDISSYLRHQALSDRSIRDDKRMAEIADYLYRVASIMNGMAHRNIAEQEEFKKFRKEAMGIYGIIQANHQSIL